MLLIRDSLQWKDTQRLTVRGETCKGKHESRLNTHIRQKILQSKEKEGHYIMIESPIYKDVITLLIYTYSILGVPNIGVPKYIKLILTNRKEESDNNGEF